jgi:NSS family neurotransmitter:Na+ symporter
MDKFKLKRWISCLVVLGISLLLGLPSALGFSVWAEVKILGMQFLDLFDFVSNSVLMPVVALATAIFVGFILKPQTLIEEAELSGEFKAKKLFEVMIKWIAPVFILAILVSSILDVFGIVKI